MPNIRILLVEDNPDDRLLIKRGIRKGMDSATILEVHREEHLAKAIRSGGFDIVITDFNLGWTNGIEVLKSVKDHWPNCPVIMMTVMDTEEVAINAMKAGLDHYVVKSASQFALMGETIRAALKKIESEQALEDAEIRYQELSDSVPIGLFRVLKEGTLLSVNQTLVNMLGYPNKEILLSVNSTELYVDPHVREKNYQKLTHQSGLIAWEAELFRYDGSIINVFITAHAIYKANQQPVYFEGYIQDISARKKIEDALLQSEILNETIVASVQDGVMVTDRDLNIVVWNNYLEELSGLDIDKVLGKSAIEILSQSTKNGVEPVLRRALSGETVFSPDTAFQFHGTDRQSWVEITYAPLRKRTGEVVGVVANIHDITERKEAETERERLLETEQKLHEISRQVSRSFDIESIINTTNSLLSDIFDNAMTVILTKDPKTKEFTQLTWHNAPEDSPAVSFGGQGMLWEAHNKMKPFCVNDYPNFENPNPVWVEYGLQCGMAIPLESNDMKLGAVGVFSTKPDGYFSERDIELASSIARQAGVALHKAILYEDSIRKTQELTALYDFSLKTGSVLDARTLLQFLYNKIKELISPDSILIYTYDEDNRQLEITMAYQKAPPLTDVIGTSYPLTPGKLVSDLILHHKTNYISKVSNEQHECLMAEKGLHCQAWLGIPLMKGEQILGALVMESEIENAFSNEDQRFLESIAAQFSIALDNARLYEELEDAYLQTVAALANAVDVRDSYTHDHSQRIAILTNLTGIELGMDKKELELLRWGALLHDIGKIGIPDHILLKPDDLTKEEYEIMKQHPAIGASIIAPVKKLSKVAPIIRAHQEHYNGEGYPDQLKGEEIPLAARVLTVVDSYVAMTDDRVYRKAYSQEYALQELKAKAGTHFDPKVVDTFLLIMEREKKPTGLAEN